MAISFGIIGCGKIAERHAEVIQASGRLLCVADIEIEKALAFGKKFKCATYAGVEQLLEGKERPDVISICSPNGIHAKQAIRCLDSGFNVLCEKPMALASKDAEEMIRAARINNRHLFIVKQNRFNPPVVAVKNLLSSGSLGIVYSVHVNCFWNRPISYYRNSWRGTRELDGGILYTQFSHFIDLLYWFFGEVTTVAAITKNSGHRGAIEFEDNGAAVLEFASGIIGSLHFTVNAYEKNMEGSITIFGERGTVKIGGEYLNKLEYFCVEDSAGIALAAGRPANDYSTYKGSMSNHDLVYDNVIAVLENRSKVYAPADDGLRTVNIIERIYAAARKGLVDPKRIEANSSTDN